MSRKHSIDLEDRVCREYEAGDSAYIIAARHKINGNTVYNMLKRNKIEIRSLSKARRESRSTTQGRGTKPRSIEDRFWEKVHKTESCWVWTGCRFGETGYGAFCPRGTAPRGAHRVSWELAHGTPIPEGMWVLHECDNPICVRPDHLKLGTAKDNSEDMVQKRRHLRNGIHPRGKLDPKMVQAIRLVHAGMLVSGAELGRMFGIPEDQVHDIVTGKTWKYLPEGSP